MPVRRAIQIALFAFPLAVPANAQGPTAPPPPAVQPSLEQRANEQGANVDPEAVRKRHTPKKTARPRSR